LSFGLIHSISSFKDPEIPGWIGSHDIVDVLERYCQLCETMIRISQCYFVLLSFGISHFELVY
jgi:hypothetical protein